ncbi:MAG TPA: pyridoxamine 5'-phosphate oxidase [Methyloceanibacter sp.]|jgi:pyridoxamine 5'-phosphate oxidase
MTEFRDQAPDFTAATDPLAVFSSWMEEAEKTEPSDPNAMALATVDAEGVPNARMILLKGSDERGFVFYTNCQSAKGLELTAAPKAALLFYWKSLHRQIRVRGPIEKVSDAEADAYFATRSRESRIGAWASQQSRPLESRRDLDEAVAKRTSEFEGKDVPRPDYWRGYRVIPLEIEFWHHRPHRLHDRMSFRRASPDAPWVKTRLYP